MQFLQQKAQSDSIALEVATCTSQEGFMMGTKNAPSLQQWGVLLPSLCAVGRSDHSPAQPVGNC